MTLDLTVITASLPERVELLNECNASVVAQLVQPDGGHSIVVDRHGAGPAHCLNRAFENVDTEWVFRLDDDDLLDPDHFEVLSRYLADDYDIVYTYCRVVGDPDVPEDFFRTNWQAEFGWTYLNVANWVPCSAAMRSTLWRELGGLRDVPLEDWDLWKRAFAAGARFACVPAVTWTYRIDNAWAHRNTRLAQDTRLAQ